MYVFVSWASVTEATKAEEQRAGWLAQLAEEDAKGNKDLIDRITVEHCLPEYAALEQVSGGEPLTADTLNADLLSVRFVIPAMEKVVTYQLAKRMPGSEKLCVSLACRAFLLNTFAGQWTGDLTAPAASRRLMFVGLRGLKDFLTRLAAACAAKGQPLPIDLWREQTVVELPEDTELRALIDACAYNQKQKSDQEKYRDLILGWMGSGASAERDSAIALATGFRLGLKGTQDGGK